MYKRLFLASILSLLCGGVVSAQVGGHGGPGYVLWDLGKLATPPDCSSSYKNFRYYDTDDDLVYYCNGSAWTVFGAGGASAFSGLTTGTNTTATMTVGAGASITFTSTGIVNANQLTGVDVDLSGAAEDDVPCVNSSGDLVACPPGLTARTDSDGTVALLSTDRGRQVNGSHATANAVSIAQAGTAGFEAGYVAYMCQTGAGATTITPTTSTINGSATFTWNLQYACARVRSDGTNYEAALVLATSPSDANLVTTDVTTNDVSTSKHGFAPKAPNDATKYLDGTGAYSVPATGGSTFDLIEFVVQAQNGGFFGNSTTVNQNGQSNQAPTATEPYRRRLTATAAVSIASVEDATISPWRVGAARLIDAQSYAGIGSTSDIVFFVGLSSTAASTTIASDNPAANLVGFQYCNDAGASCTVDQTNWQCAMKDGTTINRVNSGVAADTNGHYFRIVENASGNWSFYIDEIEVCSGPLSTNKPTAGTNTSMQVAITSYSGSKTVDLARWKVRGKDN